MTSVSARCSGVSFRFSVLFFEFGFADVGTAGRIGRVTLFGLRPACTWEYVVSM